jgi:hypothetical protein
MNFLLSIILIAVIYGFITFLLMFWNKEDV